MHTKRLPLVGVLAMVVAACSGASAPTSSGSPSASPASSPSPAVGEIDHPTGATDVVLRYEEGGGFLMPAFIVTMAPIFTLYGDGTIVFRPQTDTFPEPVNGVTREVPFKTGNITEAQIQQLLEFAISQGGLGLAVKDQYDNPMVADAGTATFTLRADGEEKKVSIYALGMDDPQVPDRAIRAAFQRLAERLRAIDQGGAFPAATYEPAGYRTFLMDGFAGDGVTAVSWPWPAIKTSDFFKGGDEDMPAFPMRTMTPAEIEATGVEDASGGFNGLLVTGPDGKLYSIAARPLLPDEES
jgi:hypothetical protein